jgi:hypothetical protein
MRIPPAALLPLGSALLLGCFATSGASSAAIPMVRERAEVDLDCPGENIRLEQHLAGRFTAIGCGHKALYETACDGLSCVVRGEGEPSIPWRDRPEPTPVPQ